MFSQNTARLLSLVHVCYRANGALYYSFKLYILKLDFLQSNYMLGTRANIMILLARELKENFVCHCVGVRAQSWANIS